MPCLIAIVSEENMFEKVYAGANANINDGDDNRCIVKAKAQMAFGQVILKPGLLDISLA